MAECFDEFDAPSPMPKRYCARMSTAEFERVGSVSTELALQELMNYLEYNPTAFFEVLVKRKQEDDHQNNIFSMFKAKLCEWYYGATSSKNELDMNEAKQKLQELKENFVRSYNYAQEAKGSGRRMSARIAQKKWRTVQKCAQNDSTQSHQQRIPQSKHKKIHTTNKTNKVEVKTRRQGIQPSDTIKSNNMNSVEQIIEVKGDVKSNRTTIETQIETNGPITTAYTFPIPPSKQEENVKSIPPPPPPPPPPPASSGKTSCKEDNDPNANTDMNDVINQKDAKSVNINKNGGVEKNTMEVNDFTKLLNAIKNPDARGALKKTHSSDSYITPPRKKCNTNSGDQYNMFNEELLKKFKNVQSSPFDSPASSETPTYFSP